MCQLYQVKKRANPAQISASIFHSMWDSHWEKKKSKIYSWYLVYSFVGQVWELFVILSGRGMHETGGCPGIIRNQHWRVTKTVAGEPWQETEPFDQRRGRDGRGWAARTSHWLRHHAGSGWRIHFHKKTIYLSVCHPKSKMNWSIFVTTVFQGETVKEHGEAGTLARSRAARDCPWAPGPTPPPSSPSSTLSSSSRAA